MSFPFFLLGVTGFITAGCQSTMRHSTITSVGSGPEDLVLVEMSDGPTLVAGTTRTVKRKAGKTKEGVLEIFNPKWQTSSFKEAPQAKPLTFPFHPVGMYVVPRFTGQDPRFHGKQLLFAINRPDRLGREHKDLPASIEVFEVQGETLMHWVTIRQNQKSRKAANSNVAADDAWLPLRGANSIAVTSRGEIVVSNFKLMPTWGKEKLKFAGKGAPLEGGGNTLVCHSPGEKLDAGSWKVIASGFNGANGLAFDAAETRLLVCSFHACRVRSFDWMEGGVLSNPEKLGGRLSAGADNIHRWSDSKYLVTGGRSKVAMGFYFATKGRSRARGQVFLINSTPGEEAVIESAIIPKVNAPSVAVPLGGKLYIGTILAKDVERMDIPPNFKAPPADE